jgi:hypothetical protein
MAQNKSEQLAWMCRKAITASFMAFVSLSSLALSTTYYASNSRLASGHWVKVRVSKEGMQQITYSQLREWGFDNPTNVKVYGYGGSMFCDHIFSTYRPDDIQPTLSVHTDDDRLIFFGDADVRTTLKSFDSAGDILYTVNRNYTSLYGYYLLTDSDAGGDEQAPAVYNPDNTKTMSQHWSINLYEKEAKQLVKTSNIFHTKTYAGGNNIEVTFPIYDCVADDDNHAVYTVEAALLETAPLVTYTVGAPTCDNVNVTTKTDCSVEACYDGTINYATGTGSYRILPTDDAATIADGEYTFTSQLPKDDNLTYAALDRAVLIYPRKNVLHSGDMIMNYISASANSNFTVEGATANTRVWNISNSSKVYEHQGYYDADTQTFYGSIDRDYSVSNVNGTCRLIAFNIDEAQNEVEFAGQVSNQNIHGAETPNMLIITTDELYDYAEQLADIHRKHDNITVSVFTQQQMFNEFGSGTPSPMAVRRGIKMFYDRNKSALKYVILYGKSLADFRQIANQVSYEPLITFEAEPITTDLCSASANSHLNFATDDYFASLKDADTPTKFTTAKATIDIPVGRIPAGDAAYAADANSKIESYYNNPLPSYAMQQALFISDNGDSNQHYVQSKNIIASMLECSPTITATQGHCLIYPHTSTKAKTLNNVIAESLSKGIGYFCYSGHAAETSFAAENLWSKNLVKSTDYKYPPIAMLATCDTYCYDRSTVGIAETMLQKNNGGMINIISSCRSVLLSANKLMFEAFTKAYASLKGTATVGSLYVTAHNNAFKNSTRLDDRLNTLCYGLCGDPAIKITMPQSDITVSEINGYTDNVAAVDAQSIMNVKAFVADPIGNVYEGYNGKATIYVYEAPHTVNTILVDSKDLSTEVTLDENLMTQVTTNVVNGKIDADIFVPVNSYAASADNTNHIVIIADSENCGAAAGISRNFYVDSSAETSDVEISLPEITELYLDRSENTDGAVIGRNTPTVYAKIKLGTAGYNSTTNIGNATAVTLDGTALDNATHAIYTDSDGYAKLTYALGTLSTGDHSLTLTVSDTAGNQASQTIGFTCQELDGDIDIDADVQTAYTEVTFNMQHSFYDTPDTRLVIEDSQRNTVFSVENPTFPYAWNLTDTNGDTVANGYYNAYILGKYGSKTAASPRHQFVVIAD